MATLPEVWKNFGTPSAEMASEAHAANSKAAANIVAGFPVISIRGKVWRVRVRGEEHNLNRSDGSGPIHRADFVILDAAEAVSQVFYEGGWDDSTASPPDCFSTNGLVPDPGAVKKQCGTCAACPRNAWGSKKLPNGKDGKECQASKRLAVVFAGDLRGEAFGGPMLLRVPAASLSAWRQYTDQLTTYSFPYYGVISGLTFDVNESFPKLEYTPVRPLTDEELVSVRELRGSDQIRRMLDAPEGPPTAPVTDVASRPVAAAPAPVATPAPVAAPEPEPEPVAARPITVAAAPAVAPVVSEKFLPEETRAPEPPPVTAAPEGPATRSEEATPAPAGIQNALEEQLRKLNIGV